MRKQPQQTEENKHKIGYIRVSTAEQNSSRQLEGVDVGKVYEDKASGKDRKRPELIRCLDSLRKGDVLYVHSIDRLARNLLDLKGIVEEVKSKGASIHFVTESLEFHPEPEPGSDPADRKHQNEMHELMFNMLGAFAQFERDIIRNRQREGIERAKAEGRRLGAKPALTREQVKEVAGRKTEGESIKDLAGEYGVSRQTIYSALKKLEGA